LTGDAIASSGDAIDMAAAGEFGSEVVENVGGVTRPGQQHNWPSRSAPIEHLQLNTLFDGHEPYLMFRRISPGDRLLRV
jgi:hypothetical protein